LWTSVALLALVVVGFAPTYYLRAFFPARPIRPLVYVHGALMTVWYVIFVCQVALVAARRTRMHRRLGVAGVVVAVAVLATGLVVNQQLLPQIEAAGVVLPPDQRLLFSYIAVVGQVTLATFAVSVGAAVVGRRRTQMHRRLMFLALLVTLPPAIGPGRWIGRLVAPWLPSWPSLTTLVFAACIGALALHDRVNTGRVHPVTRWGGLWLLAIEPLSRAFVGAL
jgi:hypothetical protein